MKKTVIALVALVVSLVSCDNLSPEMSADDFLNESQPMEKWVNGINREMALAVGVYAELLDVATDNYRNVYSRSNREFDKPNILYTDLDVEALQRYVGKLRGMALYALETISPINAPTEAQLADIYTTLAYSYLLAGENFVGIPMQENGLPVQPEAQLRKALEVLDAAQEVVKSTAFQPVAETMKARAYYRLGDKANAVAHAEKALELDRSFAAKTYYDEANMVVSHIKDRSFSTGWWEPLPRLDFLDPKYQQSTESQCIAFVKAEECYLILAEAAVTNAAALADFKANRLVPFFDLIKSRGTATFTDKEELREHEGYNLNTGTEWVKASPAEEAVSGLLLPRATSAITVPAISGTSVTPAQLAAATGDDFLQLVYLMRQEVFFAEGRRFADLGMRLPLCEVEAHRISVANPGFDVSPYVKVYLPAYLPTEDYALDNYTYDVQSNTITISHNMNHEIVAAKRSADVVPFE